MLCFLGRPLLACGERVGVRSPVLSIKGKIN